MNTTKKKGPNRLTVLLTVIPLTALALSSCAAEPGGNTGNPDGNMDTLEFTAIDSDEFKAWHDKAMINKVYYSHLIQDGDTVALLLGGSSSCPPEIDTADIDDNSNVSITLKLMGERACTADYAPYGWTAELPTEDGTEKTVHEATVVSMEWEQPQKLNVVHIATGGTPETHAPTPSSTTPTASSSVEPSTVPPATPSPTETAPTMAPPSFPVEPTVAPTFTVKPTVVPSMSGVPVPSPPVYSLPVETDLK